MKDSRLDLGGGGAESTWRESSIPNCGSRAQLYADIHRLNHALRTLSKCSVAIVHATDELMLMQEICDTIVAIGDYRVAWIGYVDGSSANEIRVIAHAGIGDGDASPHPTMDLSGCPESPVSQALRNRTANVARNIAWDVSFASWKAGDDPRSDFISCVALPLLVHSEIVGVLCIGTDETDVFDTAELSLLEDLAADVAYGRTALQAEEARKQIQEALRASEEHHRQLFEGIPLPAWVYDVETLAFLSVNETALRHYGYSREEFLAMRLTDIRPVEDVERFLASTEKPKPHKLYSAGGWKHLKKDGTVADVEITAQPLTISGRAVELVLVRDITQQRHEAEALRKARESADAIERIKADLLNNISHELRTPMNGILGCVELLLDADVTSEQREYVDLIKTSGTQLLSLIEEILRLCASDMGALQTHAVLFDVRNVIGDAVHPMSARAKEKNINLTLNITSEVPDCLVGDSSILRETILSLVGNAIKFSSGGAINVKVSVESESTAHGITLLVSVSDTGIGIPLEKQALIFEPFTQVDASSTRSHGGLGLGLALATQLVEMMGGRIWVESVPGTGSTFFFTAVLARTEQ